LAVLQPPQQQQQYQQQYNYSGAQTELERGVSSPQAQAWQPQPHPHVMMVMMPAMGERPSSAVSGPPPLRPTGSTTSGASHALESGGAGPSDIRQGQQVLAPLDPQALDSLALRTGSLTLAGGGSGLQYSVNVPAAHAAGSPVGQSIRAGLGAGGAGGDWSMHVRAGFVFRGLRVRMCAATGHAQSVTLHKVTGAQGGSWGAHGMRAGER
jgi:hypothetical protein